MGLIHERYDDVIFKDRKLVDKVEAAKKQYKPTQAPPPASDMPDSDEVQKKIDAVEEQLNMSDEDMKAKLEQEAFENGLEKAPVDEDDDTCENLEKSKKYREDTEKMRKIFEDYRKKQKEKEDEENREKIKRKEEISKYHSILF